MKKIMLVTLASCFIFVGCKKNNDVLSEEDNSNVSEISSNRISDEELLASGQYRDPNTGVIWMRCAFGQKWENNTCTGHELNFTASSLQKYLKLHNDEVAFGGYSNWRIPTISEAAAMRHCENGWEKESYWGMVMTIEGEKYQEIIGDVMTQEIPSGNEIITVPKNCTYHRVQSDPDDDFSARNVWDPAYDSNIFINQNKSYWTSTNGYGEVYSSIRNTDSAWVFNMPGGNLSRHIAGLTFYGRAVRDE